MRLASRLIARGSVGSVNCSPVEPKATSSCRLPHIWIRRRSPKSREGTRLPLPTAGDSLRDIRFLRFRESPDRGTKVEVARIGMSGNLAYELHGPIEDGPKIYDAVYRAGQEFGIERVGWGLIW